MFPNGFKTILFIASMTYNSCNAAEIQYYPAEKAEQLQTAVIAKGKNSLWIKRPVYFRVEPWQMLHHPRDTSAPDYVHAELSRGNPETNYSLVAHLLGAEARSG
jgi:hypothetical protein